MNDVRKIVEKYLDADDCNGSDVAMDILSDINGLPSAQPKTEERMEKSAQNIPNDDPISKKMAIEAINTWDKFGVDERSRVVRWCEGLEPYVRLRDVVTSMAKLPSAQPERLTDDDFETIRIHMNAYKEKLCNQQRWEEADEYQRIIDRFMAFATTQPDLDSAYTEGYTAAESKYRKIFDEFLGIVFCKDCKHWRHDDHICQYYGGASPRLAIDFCSKGERRTDEGD